MNLLRHAAAAALLSWLLAPAAAWAQKTEQAEPESTGLPYLLDAAGGAPKSLPQEPLRTPSQAGLRHVTGYLQISGVRSPFRIKASATTEFVVRLATGATPDQYTLYAFHIKKGNREAELVKVKLFSADSKPGIPRETTKYGEVSHRFIYRGLAPGEYALVVNSQAYSFGVDAQ